MNTNHRITPVEHRIPRHVEVHFPHARRPGWEISRGADFHRDADFLQSGFHIFNLWLNAGPAKINGQAKARVALHGIARRIEQGPRFVQVEVVAFNIGVIERAIGMDAGFGVRRCSLHQGLVDEILVHRIGNGFAHIHVGQWAFGGVHCQPIKRANTSVTLIGHGQAVDFLKPVDDARQGLEGAHVNFTILIGDGPRGWISDDPHDDLVEVRPAFNEKIIESFQDHMLARFILNQFKWAGSHHVFGVARVGFRILAVAIDMFRNNCHQLPRHGQHQRRMRFAQVQNGRMGIWRINRHDWSKHRFKRVVRFDRINGKGHILGCDWGAIMEHRVVDQVESDGQPVLAHVPAFGEIGLWGPILVIAQGSGKQLCARVACHDTRLHRRIKVAHIGCHHSDQGAALTRGILCNGATGQKGDSRRCREHRFQNMVHCQTSEIFLVLLSRA